jgi:hypothetical protein
MCPASRGSLGRGPNPQRAQTFSSRLTCLASWSWVESWSRGPVGVDLPWVAHRDLPGGEGAPQMMQARAGMGHHLINETNPRLRDDEGCSVA